MELVVGNHIVLFDDEDADLVLQYKWLVLDAKGYLYAITSKHIDNGKPVRMHQLLLGMPRCDIDHKNKNTLDNRRTNLRPCTRAENNANSGSRKGTSKYKGVRYQQGAWTAQIMVNRKSIYLGRFSSEELAARAYDGAALEIWGEFAFQNLGPF